MENLKFEEFLKPIQSVPMRRAMHIYRNDQPWQEQANLFLSLVKDKGFHFYTLDFEFIPKEDNPTSLSEAEQWMNYVQERVEGKVVLQTSGFYITTLGPAAEWMEKWPLLIRVYSPLPDPNGSPLLQQGGTEWKIWQYTDEGQGAAYGVGANSVALEVYNGTPREMWDWLELPDFAVYDRASNRLIRPSQVIRVSGQNGIAYSPDGAYVAAAGQAMVSLLDPESGEEITALSLANRNALSLSFTPDGHHLAIGMEEGTILLWDLSLLDENTNAESTLEAACSQVTRPFTDAEWQQYIGALPQTITCPNLRQ